MYHDEHIIQYAGNFIMMIMSLLLSFYEWDVKKIFEEIISFIFTIYNLF